MLRKCDKSPFAHVVLGLRKYQLALATTFQIKKWLVAFECNPPHVFLVDKTTFSNVSNIAILFYKHD